MSSPIDKLVLLPPTIPTIFQLPGGPVWTTEFLAAPTLAKIIVQLADGRRFNLNHFVNHYCFHTSTIRSCDLDPLNYFTVAQGNGETKTIRHHLEFTINLGELGSPHHPIYAYMKQKCLEQLEAEDLDERCRISTEMFNFIRESGLEWIRSRPATMEIIISKCHQFREEEHTHYPDSESELEKACRLLLIALDQEPHPLLTSDEIIIQNWNNLPCAHLCVILQIGTGPIEYGILHPKTGYVSTAFYDEKITLKHWFNKYSKQYHTADENPRTFLCRLSYLRSGSVTFYDMLKSNTAKEHLILAIDEDEETLERKRICRYIPEHCQCDLHRPLEPLICQCNRCTAPQK